MSDLGPRPEPATERPVKVPRGPDAIERDPDSEGLSHDLPPEFNRAVAEKTPATGQVDEAGDAEPPA